MVRFENTLRKGNNEGKMTARQPMQRALKM